MRGSTKKTFLGEVRIKPLGIPTTRIPRPSEFLWGSPQKNGRDTRRTFTETQKKQILYQQGNKCAGCHKSLDPRTTQFHHGKPLAYGGRTKVGNGRAMHPNCHEKATHEQRLRQVDRVRR